MKYKNPMWTAYLECALWSSTDEDGIPLDRTWNITDLTPEFVTQAEADCTAFIALCEADPTVCDTYWTIDSERLGHDFWLTRNRHGAGFWSRGYQGDGFPAEYNLGQALTRIARTFPEIEVEIYE